MRIFNQSVKKKVFQCVNFYSYLVCLETFSSFKRITIYIYINIYMSNLLQLLVLIPVFTISFGIFSIAEIFT